MNHALVTGALGVIGGAVADHLIAQPDWQVTTVSRRPRPVARSDRHLALDLLDDAAVKDAAPALAGATHLVFAAYAESGDGAQDMSVNVGMLAGSLDLLERSGAPLRHVTLYQGGKAYGAHLGAFRTPARETDPRLPIAHFYYAQEDLLRERAARNGFVFTILRPDIMLGTSRRSPMNLAQSLAVYALINRELELPLRFPGTLAAARPLVNCTDSGLLAEATLWAATTDTAAGRTFNVVNGDLFRWPQLFERVALYFGMPTAEPQPVALTENMPSLAPVWARLVERHNLAVPDLADLVGWHFLDFLFAAEHDGVLDPLALRLAGFHGVRRTEDAVLAVFDMLRAQRAIPAD